MTLEQTLATWATGPGNAEQEKCANAESVVRSALSRSTVLRPFPLRVFTQGSYAARTNVRLDSDVDICACRDSSEYFYDLPTIGSQNPGDYGIFPKQISFGDFKNAVGSALADYVGAAGMTRGNKAFDVHANTYRIDADVVPAFEYRQYTGFDVSGAPRWETGIKIFPDYGTAIINWPQQNYGNGVAKNDRTGRRYKRLVRVLKRMRNAMRDKKVSAAEGVASFLIECLVWNSPDDVLMRDSYTDALRGLLVHTFNGTISQDKCNEWGEVNEIKYLFRDGLQPWTRQQANDFLGAAWEFAGFK